MILRENQKIKNHELIRVVSVIVSCSISVSPLQFVSEQCGRDYFPGHGRFPLSLSLWETIFLRFVCMSLLVLYLLSLLFIFSFFQLYESRSSFFFLFAEFFHYSVYYSSSPFRPLFNSFHFLFPSIYLLISFLVLFSFHTTL